MPTLPTSTAASARNPLEEALELGLVDGKAQAAAEPQGKHEGKLLKDVTDEELLDHFVDVVDEIKGRVIDEDLVEAKIPDELKSGANTGLTEADIPDDVVPGETPGWPIVNGVVIDLPDEVREELAEKGKAIVAKEAELADAREAAKEAEAKAEKPPKKPAKKPAPKKS